jgi:hypothetical protein
MSLPDLYEIQATPAIKTVTPGALVTYFCAQRYATITAADAPRDKFQWYCWNDSAMAKALGKPFVVKGPRGVVWEDARWSFVGRHTVLCQVLFKDGGKGTLEYPQWVDTVEAVLGDIMRKHRTTKLPDPDAELSVVTRYIEALKDAEKMFPITNSRKKEEHDKQIAQLTEYRDKLSERLQSTNGHLRVPIYAAHLEIQTQRKSTLRAFVSRISQVGRKQTWELVDWTNAAVRELTGVYEGSGNSAEEAIRDAIAQWDSDNRYYNGKLTYEVPKEAAGKAITGEFTTDGKSFWDSVAEFFSYIALGAAVVAGVVTLIAPVPGSQVVSAAIWTSIFSSTTAAVINIGQRYDEGFSNWKDEAFDGLTIVGNIFGGAWLRCGKLAMNTSRTGAATFVLVGQVATDGVQGVLILQDHIGKYDQIMNDRALSPDERTKKLLELFRSLAIDGLMIYVSVKGTKSDLDNLGAGKIDKKKLDDLKNPNKTVSLEDPPKIQGNTDNKKVVGKTQDEHPRQDAPPGKPVTRPVVPKLKEKHTNGIPHDELKKGKFLVLGLYNKEPSMAEWIKQSGAMDAKLVTDYPNPLYKTGQQPGYVEPPAGFYSNVKELSTAAIKWTTKLEGRAILVDMNGVDIQKALKSGLDPTVYNKVTSHELRYLRDHWDEFSPPPKFFENGEEVARPW